MHHTEKIDATSITPDNIIARDYIDINNQHQSINEHTRQTLLTAMVPAYTEHNAPVPPVKVFTDHNTSLMLAGAGKYQWVFITEQGKKIEGSCMAGQQLELPTPLAEGYHSLTLYQQPNNWHCRIIIAPRRCFQPAALACKQKLWGTSVQLYTLRSLNNWGIGDFGDLQKLLRDIIRTGGAFVGLNPLHALYPAQPDNASPYSPSSRQWLNIIYIDVNAVEDFQINAEAEDWWSLPETQKKLNAVRNTELVDYPAVMELKLAALNIAWRQFSRRTQQDKLMLQFQRFINKAGDGLYRQAVYDALHQWLINQNPTHHNWSQWPAHYQQPDSPQVAVFCRNHTNEIEFYCWLQWLAQKQLASCWEICQQSSMPVGLYRDLAVGVAQHGAATWSDRTLYCQLAATGAPPDPLGPQGQNWQLPPINPWQLIARAYQPFIDVLRANMRYCGALRIDHIMSLMRLWWIPQGERAAAGAYVHYPLDDLLAILALESQRNHCIIIGEDLGLVPPALLDKLRDAGIYAYKVLYFAHDEQQGLPSPTKWAEQALATINTHDLPTMQGYWQAGDLHLGKSLGIYPDNIFSSLYQQRQQQKQQIVDSMHRYHCLPSRAIKDAKRNVMTPILYQSIYRYMASCHSALLSVQPEDWLGMPQPVNVPGTDGQYPNWRRKLNRSLDEIFMDSDINRLLITLNKYRKQASKKDKLCS